jgi:hypothetical protein
VVLKEEVDNEIVFKGVYAVKVFDKAKMKSKGESKTREYFD